MTRIFITGVLSLLILFINPIQAQKKRSKSKKQVIPTEKIDSVRLDNTSLSGLSFRSIGPSVTGGRIIDIDVNPNDHSEYYVASGHGSLWKTENGGVTFNPVFDGQNTFAMGAVAIDPGNPNIVWVGTGENNAHSYVIPGDGIYRSEDGGISWENKGLKESQQIGEIIIHPNNPDIVWVAAYGPHRQSGGERGVYKTKDGGSTWERVLFISDHTGCWELHMDPRDPDVLYTVAHQRQRQRYTIVGGGDESGIHKTTDGGKSWKKLKGGLPQENVGRIGMDISPANPDILYAVVNAKEGKGIYKSDDRGASWTKESTYNTAYAFYMQKLFCDTENPDKIYAMDIFAQVSNDGGKSWSNLGEDKKHVDNHTLWIDPDDNRHLLSGCDGGVYESFNGGKHWDFKSNIPIAEVYKVTVDNSKPFYNVYIGTQDNLSLGGPSRTINSSGITNSDWYFTLGGDGFETQVDWKDPNIVYSQYQNGNLYRYDKKSGERLFIKTFEFGDTAYRFNWDAALLISKHDNKRLYHAGNKIVRSDNQGNSWREFSPDLTRGVPEEFLPLMDRSWSIDELVSKSSLAQISTIAESPLDENILFAGSADGLIHYTHDGGQTWKKGSTPGLPREARIHHIIASNHNKMVAYAACQDVFSGNFQPYIYKSSDGGSSWKAHNNGLPEFGSTFSIGEDHVDPNLLFVGTMYGLYISNKSTIKWNKFNTGMPNAATVMDLDIHRDEQDLVVSTFGRGVYILDDYSPLRSLNDELLEKEATIFPIQDAEMFIEADPFGYPGVAFQGASFYSAPNPSIGAIIYYYVKEVPKSLKELRREKEKKLSEENKKISYPAYEELKKEKEEVKPYLTFVIEDENGNVIRKIKKEYKAGLQKLNWDFRYSPVVPISMSEYDSSIPWNSPDLGYMVVPGTYQISLFKQDAEKTELLSGPHAFNCNTLNNTSLPVVDYDGLNKFNEKAASLSRAANGANSYISEARRLLKYYRKAILQIPAMEESWYSKLKEIENEIREVNIKLNGDPLLSSYEGGSRTSVKAKIDLVTSSLWTTTSAQTATFERAYQLASDEFASILISLSEIDEKMDNLENQLEKAGAPATPGRLPKWKK